MVELKELLDLLESSKKKTQETKYSGSMSYSVKRFINEYNIKSGEKRIHNYIIFYYYKSKFNYPTKLDKIRFFQVFSQFFMKARIGKQRYYLLDPTPFELTREGKLEAKLYDKQYKIRSEAKKKVAKRKNEKT